MKNQRAELSPKNKYWIPKYRYLELKNFCLQYPDWKNELRNLSVLKAHTTAISSSDTPDPTHDLAMKRLKLEENINLIDSTAELAERSIAKWLIKGITESYTYEYLKLQLDLPAGREMYYDRYRKFFYLLDKYRS